MKVEHHIQPDGRYITHIKGSLNYVVGPYVYSDGWAEKIVAQIERGKK